MEFRHLGRSGMLVSEISYGNWITHGSQVEEDAGHRLRARRPRPRHHHLRHRRRLRRHPGRGRARPGAEGRAPRGPGDLHQGLLADRARAATTAACPASTSWSRSTARCAGCRPTTSTCTRRTATTTRPRSRRRCEAFADVVHAGKAHYIGVSEWTRRARSGPRYELARELKIQLVSNQPQYSMLWRVIEAEVVPTCEELGIGQIVWSPIAQGVLTGKYLPGQPPPAGSRATDEKSGAQLHLPADGRRRADRGAAAQAARRAGRADHGPARPSRGCCRTRTSPRRSSARPGPSSCRTT